MEKYVLWQLLQTHSVSSDTHKTNSRWKYHSLKHVRSLVREEMVRYFPWQGTWHLFGGMRVVKWDCGLRGRGCGSPWLSVVHSFLCVPATLLPWDEVCFLPTLILGSTHAASGDFFFFSTLGLGPLGFLFWIQSLFCEKFNIGP